MVDVIDCVRTDLKVNFICAKCGEKLIINRDIKRGCHSAYDVTLDILVEPCPNCISKAEEPIKNLKQILNEVNDY